MNEEKGHKIRFINSSYDTLFRIPDGGTIEVRFPDRVYTAKCGYIDDYHTRVGYSVFHICEFAEMIERQGGRVRPEPEVSADRAAWRLGGKEYLILEKSDNRFAYTLCSSEFQVEKKGFIKGDGISMKEAREMLLENFGLSDRSRMALPPESVTEKLQEADRSLVKRLRDLSKNRKKESSPAVNNVMDRDNSRKAGKEVRHGGVPAR